MTEQDIPDSKANDPRAISVLGQRLVIPGIGLLAMMAALLAVLTWLLRSMGLPVSTTGFVFGCGVMWLMMAGLDLRAPKAWLLMLSWALAVFLVALGAGAIAG